MLNFRRSVEREPLAAADPAFAMIIARQSVLSLGEPLSPSFEAALKERGLVLTASATPTEDQLRTACGVIVNARGKSVGSIKVSIDNHAERALNHGLILVIRLDGEDNLPRLQAMYPQLASRWVFFDPSRSDVDLAELVRSHDPGPAENGALAVPDITPDLTPEDEILLRRAFNDCEILTLKPITEGRSRARVLRAHAKRAGADPPGFLLPFLVKIDDIDEIKKEMDRYKRFVSGHIPFTQRPNLDSNRCVSGASRGIMVADFVEDAVSLAKICDRPEGRRVIYSLFDDGLRSWRRHAEAGGPSPPLPITDHLGDIVQAVKIPAEVRLRASRLGLHGTPEAILADLAKHSSHSWRLGTIHGDLHPGNVMVRAGEAIIIDFASIWDQKKPLIADLACLEVAICFTVASDGCIKSAARTSDRFNVWKNTIDILFSESAIQRVPSQQEPEDLGWLWDACRQTRGMATHLESKAGAYASALVLYLLRRARLLNSAADNPSIEAYALVVAERIIAALKAGRL